MGRFSWAVLVLLALARVSGQEGTREIWDSGFRQKRPPSPPPERATKAAAAEKPLEYRPSSPAQEPGGSTLAIGFTVWRLRLPGRGDELAPRLLVPDTGQPTRSEYVPERLESNDPLRVGDRIRLGIEVPRAGFLYVIDREKYADGSLGVPHLLFPALSLRGGDNRIEPGRLIEIPGQTDRAPALLVTRQGTRYIGEELLVLVTPRPLPDVVLGDRETALTPQVVAGWERDWGGDAQRLDLVGAKGTWTASEKESGLAQRLLTQDDPMPQSIYRANVRQGAVLVRIPLTVQ